MTGPDTLRRLRDCAGRITAHDRAVTDYRSLLAQAVVDARASGLSDSDIARALVTERAVVQRMYAQAVLTSRACPSTAQAVREHLRALHVVQRALDYERESLLDERAAAMVHARMSGMADDEIGAVFGVTAPTVSALIRDRMPTVQFVQSLDRKTDNTEPEPEPMPEPVAQEKPKPVTPRRRTASDRQQDILDRLAAQASRVHLVRDGEKLATVLRREAIAAALSADISKADIAAALGMSRREVLNLGITPTAEPVPAERARLMLADAADVRSRAVRERAHLNRDLRALAMDARKAGLSMHRAATAATVTGPWLSLVCDRPAPVVREPSDLPGLTVQVVRYAALMARKGNRR